MGRLSGKVAIITGAGSGIGAETARVFAAEGAKVVVATRRRESAEAIAKQIEAANGVASPVWGDLAEEHSAQAIVEHAVKTFGAVHVLHSNAAITDSQFTKDDGDVAEMSPAVWHKTLAVNLVAPATLCKYALPHMIAAGGGSVIFTGSGKGHTGDYGHSAYAASKAGLVSLSGNLAAQYGKQGIRSNIIIVGLVMTEALDAGTSEAFRDLVRSHTLVPELGKPRDIANTALFLASDESKFITGHSIYADGGFMAHAPQYADINRMRAGGGH